MEHLSYQQHLDALIAFASTEERKADLLEAKAEYFKLTGEIFEDDKFFEQRMAAFLDYYLYDRVTPGGTLTPAQQFYEQVIKTEGLEQAAPYRGFTETLHALFEVRKIGKGDVKLRELFSAKDYLVTERRTLAGVQKGDIMEARLIPYQGHLLFSAAFVYHPAPAHKLIRDEVKRRKKKEPDRKPQELVWDCAKRAIKVERYRQIAVEKLYDFEHPTI